MLEVIKYALGFLVQSLLSLFILSLPIVIAGLILYFIFKRFGK